MLNLLDGTLCIKALVVDLIWLGDHEARGQAVGRPRCLFRRRPE